MPPGISPTSNAWETDTYDAWRSVYTDYFVVSLCGRRYLDVVNRLDPVVVAFEKEDRPVIVVSHQVKLKCGKTKNCKGVFGRVWRS